MSAPRVLTLTTVDISLDRLLRPTLVALRAHGYHAEAASADGPYAQQLRDDGFIVHALPFQRKVVTWSHVTSFVKLLRLLREGRYDILHVHTPFAQVIGRIAGRIARVPLIFYTSHGFQFHESRSWWARRLIIAIERTLGRFTNMLFTQSAEDAETAVQLGIVPRDRVQWIGNGVDVHRFSPGAPDEAGRRALGLEMHHRVVGFVGRLVREKGVVELVEAMAIVRQRVPDARLLIIGDTLDSDGDKVAKAAVTDAIRRNNLESVVVFAGLRHDVPQLLPQLDLFVLPSWREGMPRSIIEAMVSALPVVATNIRGCREEVVEGETGFLVPVRNPEMLAKAITDVLQDSVKARKMGTAGRTRALDLFDEEKVIERELATYRRMLEAKQLPAPRGRNTLSMTA